MNLLDVIVVVLWFVAAAAVLAAIGLIGLCVLAEHFDKMGREP